MNKTILFFIYLLIIIINKGFSQNKEENTILVNETTTTFVDIKAIKNIKKIYLSGETQKLNIDLTEVKSQKIIKIKAKTIFNSAGIIILTENETILYTIKYSKENADILIEIKGIKDDNNTQKIIEKENAKTEETKKLQKILDYNINEKTNVFSSNQYDIKTTIENIINYNENFYYLIKIENNSTIEYIIDNIQTSIIYLGRKNKINDIKETRYLEIYTELLKKLKEDEIKPNEYLRVLLKIERQSINESQRFQIKIIEKTENTKNSRDIELSINEKIFNNPVYLSENFEKKPTKKINSAKEIILNLKYHPFKSTSNPAGINININILSKNNIQKFSYEFGINYENNKNKNGVVEEQNTTTTSIGGNIGAYYNIFNKKNISILGGINISPFFNQIKIPENKNNTRQDISINLDLKTYLYYNLKKIKIGISPTYRQELYNPLKNIYNNSNVFLIEFMLGITL